MAGAPAAAAGRAEQIPPNRFVTEPSPSSHVGPRAGSSGQRSHRPRSERLSTVRTW